MRVIAAITLAVFFLGCPAKKDAPAADKKAPKKVVKTKSERQGKLEKKALSRIRFGEGLKRMQDGEFEVARDALEQAQLFDDTHAESYRLLATVYRKLNDARQCEQMTKYFELEKRDDEMKKATLKTFCEVAKQNK